MITGDLTLAGGATAVWIFQITTNLNVSAGTRIVSSGGALPENVIWQVGGNVTLGGGVTFDGIVLGNSVTCGSGVTIRGRLLSHAAVVIDNATVNAP